LANQQVEYVPVGTAGPGQVVVINQPPVQRWSPGLAAVLSFFVPGLGQLYKGQILNGIVWFFLVGMGYLALILPGLILHFFCVLGALSGNPWTEGKTTVVRQ
jgi:TM2 domain-containing membrane protein YozV